MEFLNKLFNRHSKQEALGSLASQFDEGKDKLVAILLEGLSDPELRERQHCVLMIRERIMPALDLDPDPASNAASVITLQKLMADLRPPRGDAEMSDLNNAAFHYMRQQVLQNS